MMAEGLMEGMRVSARADAMLARQTHRPAMPCEGVPCEGMPCEHEA